MKKLLLISCLLPLLAGAQNFHISARLGIASYQGDLKANALSLSQSKFMGSLGARYDLSEHFTLRSYLTYATMQGDDKKGTESMKSRNLSFTSRVLEWENGIQYNFLDLNNHWWTPYAFAGIGIYHFNPYANDTNGVKAYLRPLSTEGQGFAPGVKKYALTQFNIPFGLGAERMLNEDTRIGIEFGYRKLFTDYLDDVSTVYVDEAALLSARGSKAVEFAYRGGELHPSTYPTAGTIRGNSKYKDGWFYISFTFTRRFYFDKYKEIAGMASPRKDKKVGCPATRY